MNTLSAVGCGVLMREISHSGGTWQRQPLSLPAALFDFKKAR